MKEKIIYIEHQAGSFEQGLQICIHCGTVICDYTGSWVSTGATAVMGFPEGAIWVTGINPVQWTSLKPLKNYGGGDPHERIIVKCV